MWILILVLVAIVLYLVFKYFKSLKIGSLSLVSGGVKTGKTTLAVYLATREIKKAKLRWYIIMAFLLFYRKAFLYTNATLLF